jgi:uncharacterized protein YbjT (DUF2867 family)
MRVLVTGVSGYVGAALAPRLRERGHEVVGFARSAERVERTGVELDDLVLGDAQTGAGLEDAVSGVDVAYYLIHSMEGPVTNGAFAEAELRSARNFARAAKGVRRVVYLGGLVPAGLPPSTHLASRLAVEEELLASAPEPIGFRASIVVGARSRSFRFLVRLVERLRVVPLPAWREHRTRPVDGRDVLEYLLRATDADAAVTGRSWDIAGPEIMTYERLIHRIADAMLVARPALRLSFSLTPIASVVASSVAGEDVGLIRPLMEGLEYDLLPRDESAPEAFGVRLHGFDSAVERALREWETIERLGAR